MTSASSPVVVLQRSTKPFTAFNSASDGTDSFLWVDEMVAQTLLVSSGMIMLDVIPHHLLK